MQSEAKSTDTFVNELQEYGMKNIRTRNDVLTQHDFKNALIVWFFQFCLCFYVIIRADQLTAENIKDQLNSEYGVTRLITQIVMHILM